MTKKTESGQAIVLLVFAVVGLIGFTALAIDGGMLYSDRRHAQSASDAASLAGGGFAALALENYHIYYENFDCSDPDLNPANTSPTSLVNKSITAAENRAYSNDYVDAQVTVTAVCVDNGPPLDENYLEFTTDIVRETKTSLIHMVYDGPTVNEVMSTVRVRPRSPAALGNAIVALNYDDCDGNQNGVILGGSSGTYVHGGGIFSNGCLKCNGSGTSHEVIVDPPDGIFYVDESEGCSEGELDPPAQPNGDEIAPGLYDVEVPDCSAVPSRSMSDFEEDEDGLLTILPGRYNKINDNGLGNIKFEPGLYCVSGSPLGIKISTAYFEGIFVTFYVTNGGVQITGTGDEDHPSVLRAPLQHSGSYPAIDGVLLYMAHGNDSEVKITGNSDTEFGGTVYAPDGDIVATGTGDSATPFGTQLIGMNVEIAGNAYIDVDFDDDDVHEVPSWIDLTK